MRRTNLSLSVPAAVALLALVPGLGLAQEKPTKPETLSGFHLVLLVGLEESEKPGASGSGDGLTPAVIQALKNVQQFLPFKSYKMYDSTFVRGGTGTTSIKAPGNEIYVADVFGRPLGEKEPGRLYVRLTLTATASSGVASPGEAAKAAAVLNTSFDMAVGETIVAGTSRQPRSGTALIMVVTALPPSALR